MEFRVDYLLNALPIMGWGMLSIFVVTAVIVAAVSLLKLIPDRPEEK